MQSSDSTAEKDRRAAVRYKNVQHVTCRFLGQADDEDGWRATISDVSRTGVSLLTAGECVRGSVIVTSLKAFLKRLDRPVLLRVRSVRKTAKGGWQVGCSFVTALTDDDIAALLAARS